MKYWTLIKDKWVKFTDHQDHHRKELLAHGKFVTSVRPFATLTKEDMERIMRQQSWDGIEN